MAVVRREKRRRPRDPSPRTGGAQSSPDPRRPVPPLISPEPQLGQLLPAASSVFPAGTGRWKCASKPCNTS